MELLVVIAVIGVLVGILLPAIQSAREAARRLECQQHLKQLGLAFLNHENIHGFFPSGGWNWDTPPTYVGDNPVVGGEQRAGWGYQVLPFLELAAIWKSPAEVAIGHADAVFFCPTRRGPETVVIADHFDPPISGAPLKRALCDYAAADRHGEGIVRQYVPRRARDVQDGLSHTLVLGEKRLNVSELGTPQEDDNEGYSVGWNSDTIRRTDRRPKPDYRGSDDEDGEDLFGSSHSALIHAVMGDGSVHVISYSVDRKLFQYLGNIHDSQTVSLEDL